MSTISNASDNLVFENMHLKGTLSVQSWKTLRDAHVVKQDLDYSCGAASLATLLNEFYGQSATEAKNPGQKNPGQRAILSNILG